ncbi:facilitated trehalose transporter Tret1-like isoform X2 [Leptidea sinapis]|nr:facilitated trehalose transporter Tret1-like isoform X2 [Leptidea sinapis]
MLVKLQDPEKTPLSRPLTDAEGSWVVSLGFLLAAGSNFASGYIIDIIGRKFCIVAVSIPKLLSAILLIFATELWMVLLGRSVMLMSDMLVFLIVPIYAAEIASKNQRGALGTLLQLFSSIGILISLAIGPIVSYHELSYILLGLIILAMLPGIFIPESPYYLHFDGKTDDSLKILSLLRGSETQAKQEVADYDLTIDKNFDKIACLKDKIFVKALLIALVLYGGTQLVGYNAVSFYLQTILISTNTNVVPGVASAIIGAIQVVSSLFVTLIISSFGRKTILLVSLAGMCVGMFGLGGFFQTSSLDGQITGFMNYLPIVSLLLVVICYCAGIGSVVWPATTELFEGQARAFGVSIGLTFTQLIMFLTTKYFSTMTNAFGPASTYWFFGTNCVIIAVVIAIFLPETKGKTFAEIQKALGKKDTKQNITA